MKKIIPVILILCFVLASCGAKTLPADTAARDILDKVLESQSDVPQSENLFTAKDANMDEYTFSIVIDGMYEEIAEYALLDDYAMYLCDGNHTYEIDIRRAKSAEDAAKLESALKRRLELLSGGDKAMYDPDFDKMISSAKVYSDGNFAFLLITADNDAAVKAIDAFKK